MSTSCQGMRWWILPGVLASNRESGSRLNAHVNIFVTGLSYKTAPVEVREKLAVRPSLLPCLGCRLKINAGLEEVVLLSTCNRVEVYGTAPLGPGPGASHLPAALPGGHGRDALHLCEGRRGRGAAFVFSDERSGFHGDWRDGNHRPGEAGLPGRAGREADRKGFEPCFPDGAADRQGNSHRRRASAAARLPWAVWPWNWPKRFLPGICRTRR